MPCKIQIRSRIREDIDSRLSDSLQKSRIVAEKKAAEINSIYGPKTVTIVNYGDHLDREINIPESIVDRYYDSELKLERLTHTNPQEEDANRAGVDYSNDYLFQKTSLEGKLASEKTLRDLAARLASRIGMPVIFESDRTKNYKGKIVNNVAYINLAHATLDTPIHEILGHAIIRTLKNKSLADKSPGAIHLYNNLLKELNHGIGKEVFNRIKRNYDIKDVEDSIKVDNPLPDFSEGGISLEQYAKSLVDWGYSLNQAIDDLKLHFKGSDKEWFYHNRKFNWTPEFNGDEPPSQATTVEEIMNHVQGNSLSAPKVTYYTYEEQQEEALVELLGLMTANKLDAIKDSKLISLLKNLLKEIKQFVRSMLTQREVDVDKLPDNMTLGDLSNLLAYSNSKLILPGYEVQYTTPDNLKFKTYQEASNHISELAKNVTDVDLSKISLNKEISEEEKKLIADKEKEIEVWKEHLKSDEYQKEKATELKIKEDRVYELEHKELKFHAQEPYLDPEDRKKYDFGEYEYVRVESTYGRGNTYFSDILGKDYEGYYIHGYNTRAGLPDTKVVPITKAEAEAIWDKDDPYSKVDASDRHELYNLKHKVEYIKSDGKISYKISQLKQDIKKIQEGDNDILGFINKNIPFEQSKHIIEKWKKVNNIQYNPEEIYSRGQGFYSVVGAYSNVDAALLFQNLLHHIEDNEKSGGEFVISTFTKPVDERLHHLEAGGKIKFEIYPSSKDIKWAASTDVYSGSVWDASKKVSIDKKSELLGVSYTKAPALGNVGAVRPNLAEIIDNISHAHNELGIALTGNNFRLIYDDNIPYETKKIVDGINSILDQKYGKIVKPNISKGHPIEPTQTKENLTASVDDVSNSLGIRYEYADDFEPESPDRSEKVVPELEQYTNQAMINTKIAALKEAAKKYPRSLIRSEVKSIEDTNPYSEDIEEAMFQKVDKEQEAVSPTASKAATVTVSKIKEAAEKMGIKIIALKDYIKGNPDVIVRGINGLADLIKGVVAIAEGKENVALVEETVHVASAIIEQTNPTLITEMISKIGRFKIYDRVLKEYKDNKAYQLENGKPNIRKIKREAVDKLIAELIINKNEGDTEFPELREETNRSTIRNWWNNIMDFIRGMYKKANIDIFQEASQMISEGNVEGDVSNIKSNEIYHQQITDKQQATRDEIMKTQQSLRKVASDKTDDQLLDDEANNWYEIFTPEGWERVKHRVTDRVKNAYSYFFKDKNFTEAEKIYNEARRKAGVLFHSYMEEIHGRMFNQDGTKRDVIGDKPDIPGEHMEIYAKLENYFSDLVESMSKDDNTPLIFSEVKVYDPKAKEAGTIDFLAIDSDGKAHILDWKFMTIKQDAKDIAWFKKNAYDIQLGRYKNILKEFYGIKEIGMIRAIPVTMKMKKDDKTQQYSVTGILIGSVDVSKIQDLTLLPVSEKSETTGIEKLDKVVSILQGMLSSIKGQKVSDEDSRQFKNERINKLAEALRYAQTQQDLSPLISVISTIKREGDDLLDIWKTIWKDRGAKGIDNAEKSEFAGKMHDYRDVALAFEEIDSLLRKIIYNKDEAEKATTDDEKADWAKRKQISDDLRSEVESISESRREIDNISKEFVNKFMGWANNIPNLLTPEKILKGLKATFYNVSMLPNAALQVLNKLIIDSSIVANRNALGRVNSLLNIKKELSAAGNLREQVSRLYQKNAKGDNMNKLFYKYDREFYNKIEENSKQEKPDMQWLKDNIDLAAYKIEAQERIDRGITKYKNDYKHDNKTANTLITELKQKWDIEDPNFNGWNNYVIRRHPLEKWLSKEYKDIQTNKPLADLYNLIYDVNHEAASIGYIENKRTNTFLPFLRKGFAEKVAWRENPLEMMNWENSLRINPDDTGFGKMNEMNGKYDHSIPKYFTYDFTSSGEEASEDMFKNLILYFSHVEKYRELTNLENQIKLLQDVEEMKDHIEVNVFGDPQKDAQGRALVSKGNEANSKVLDKFVRTMFYGEKYVASDADMAINVHPQEAMKKVINFVAGHEVYKVDENPDPISLTKTIDALNQFFRVKTLGGNAVSGLAVYFGSGMQVMSQAGRYFTAGEFRVNNAIVFRNKFTGPEREMWSQLMEHFMPLRESIIDDKLRTAGMSAMTNLDIKHKLMMVMSFPSEHIEQSIFLSLLQNSMIENGKIVNIRDYVKAKYEKRFNSSQDYQDSKNKIADEIKELQKTRSIDAIKKMENGKLVIPGLDMSNTTEADRLTKLTRRISETSTHGRTASDANQSAMNIWLNSMMVFKTWMPKLIKTRFDSIERVNDDFSTIIDDEGNISGERYDIGRIRLFMHTMGFNIFKGAMRIHNIISMNDAGIRALDATFEEYAKDYEDRTGQSFNMSREDFFEMVKNNLHNEARELGALLLLTAAVFSMGFIAPGDPKDKAAKNSMAFFHKTLSKFHDQLGMFYDPREWSKVLSGGIFPALGIFGDIGKFMQNSVLLMTGTDIAHPFTDPDKVRRKAQPLKYGLEIFPISKQFITYMSMIDSEFAKDFDVTVSSQNLK